MANNTQISEDPDLLELSDGTTIINNPSNRGRAATQRAKKLVDALAEGLASVTEIEGMDNPVPVEELFNPKDEVQRRSMHEAKLRQMEYEAEMNRKK